MNNYSFTDKFINAVYTAFLKRRKAISHKTQFLELRDDPERKYEFLEIAVETINHTQYNSTFLIAQVFPQNMFSIYIRSNASRNRGKYLLCWENLLWKADGRQYINSFEEAMRAAHQLHPLYPSEENINAIKKCWQKWICDGCDGPTGCAKRMT